MPAQFLMLRPQSAQQLDDRPNELDKERRLFYSSTFS